MVETFGGRLPVFACFWLREHVGVPDVSSKALIGQ
jgi:hypothetical protein